MQAVVRRRGVGLWGLMAIVSLAEWGLFSLMRMPAQHPPLPDVHRPIRVTLVRKPSFPAQLPPNRKSLPTPPRKMMPHHQKTLPPKPVFHKDSPPKTASSPAAKSLLASSNAKSTGLGWENDAPSNDASGKDFMPPSLLTHVDTSRLYTEKMKDSREEGDVVIDAWIDPEGQLIRYTIVIPSVYDDLNQVAIRLLKTLSFRSARFKGKPVSGQFQLNFRFRLQST